jgi:aromatic ring-opening dioxygenase LigB subunit
MVLERAYIIPHGDEILSLPNKESKEMNEMIRKFTNDDSADSILIISPHSLRLNKCIPVINTKYLSGYYKIEKSIIRKKYESDRELNGIILSKCNDTDEVNFITSDGKLSSFPVDFGSLIPLYFFKVNRVSILGQWRSGNREALINFGKCLFHSIRDSDEKITVIFSADQAHTHNSKGPYGYSPDAKKYDELVIKTLRSNDFDELIGIDEKVIENAKPDSYWNMLSFYGFIREASLKPAFRYYYVQEYFGMIFADTIS